MIQPKSNSFICLSLSPHKNTLFYYFLTDLADSYARMLNLRIKKCLPLLVVSVSVLFLPDTSNAQLKCLKVTTDKKGKILPKILTTAKAKCPRGTAALFDISKLVGAQGERGEQGPVGAQGAQGSQGTNGANGEDGAVKVWGDGSAGNLTVDDNSVFDSTNLQYQNVTFGPNALVNIPSGTTIRATGTCQILGELTILNGANGGSSAPYNPQTLAPARRFANFGLSFGPPGIGEYGTNANRLLGGYPGKGLTTGQAGNIVTLSGVAYGSGGEGADGSFSGGAGGGGFALYCRAGITILGTVVANGRGGSNGGGGGAGGLVILASQTSITNSGVISANGGNGGDSNLAFGRGGGGGGGIIHFLSPQNVLGGTLVNGGSAGSIGGGTPTVTVNPRAAGSGGGAFGGDGGEGGDVETNNTSQSADPGQVGHVLTTTADPTSLIL